MQSDLEAKAAFDLGRRRQLMPAREIIDEMARAPASCFDGIESRYLGIERRVLVVRIDLHLGEREDIVAGALPELLRRDANVTPIQLDRNRDGCITGVRDVGAGEVLQRQE